MSAFMVDKVHIDAMVQAGLDLARHAPLRWIDRDLTEEEELLAYERGEPWGPEMAQLYQKRRRELTEQTAGQVGAMLLAENALSVNHRYDESEDEEPYVFERLPGRADPVLILKAIDCYEYQACEHPDWRKCESRAFCDALRSLCIGCLPGYEAAPAWEIRDRDVFLKHCSKR